MKTKDFKLEETEIMMPSEMLKLRGALPSMDKAQLEFLICHMMRRYVKGSETFDMVYESKMLIENYENGFFPGTNKRGAQEYDWSTVKSMEEAGYWLALPDARMLMVKIARDANNLKTTEIIKRVSAEVEGSKVAVTQKAIVGLACAVLRLAGLGKYQKYRKAEGRGVTVWSSPSEEHTAASCIALLENRLSDKNKDWEV